MYKRRRILIFLLIFSLKITTGLAATSAKSAVRQGNLLYNKGEFSQALKNYEQAFLAAPQSDIVNFNLGAGLYKTGDYQAAGEHFERVLVSEDKSLQQHALYNLGNAKYKFGISREDTDLPKAISLLKESLRHYQGALELEPEDQDARYNYEFVQKELERLLQKQQQQQSEQQKRQNQGQGQQQQNQQQQQTEQQDKQQQEQQAQEEQQQQQQEQEQEQAKQQQQSAASLKPQQPEQDNQRQDTQQAENAEQMSEQEALMLLQGYSQDEEPKGLYKEKGPAYGYPEVLKDW